MSQMTRPGQARPGGAEGQPVSCGCLWLRGCCCCLQGALVMPLMAQGFRMGLIKFVLVSGKKQ